MGHLTLLGLSSMVPGYPIVGGTLEIIVNGWIVGHKTIFAADNPPVNGVFTMNVETDLILNKSSWIAARVADDPDNKQRILPRGLSVFAHTNPVYFLSLCWPDYPV